MLPPDTTTLRELSRALRTALSAFLVTIGLGYLTALALMFLVEIDPHQKAGHGVIEGIAVKYRGSPTGSRLEAALRGSMGAKLPAPERDALLDWVRAGAAEPGYAAAQPVFERSCVACHSAKSGMPLVPLDSYAAVRKLTGADRGPSLAQLARVSHVHIFGMSFIFLLTGSIFALSSGPAAFKTAVVLLPFVSIWADIGSWWVTRYDAFFAYVVFAGGALMGAALAVQIAVSLWQMWFARPPARP